MVEGSWWGAAVAFGVGIVGIGGTAALRRRRRKARSDGGGGGGGSGSGSGAALIGRRRARSSGWASGIASASAAAAAATEQQEEEEEEGGFVCRRVCSTERLLRRVGSFAKDVTPNNCVTVCGVSDVDACAEACARAVCSTPHHVPNWNDVCMRRCQSECLRSSTTTHS